MLKISCVSYYLDKVFEGDNLILLNNLPNDSINLIYCDLLYGTGSNFKDYKDLKSNYKSFKEFYVDSNRLKLMCDKLKQTGTIALQCDYNYVHYLRLELENILGSKNYRNTIIWNRGSNFNYKSPHFYNCIDFILVFSKSDNYTYNEQFTSLSDSSIKRYNLKDVNGYYMLQNIQSTKNYKKNIDKDVRVFNNEVFINKPNMGWDWTQETLNSNIKKGYYIVKTYDKKHKLYTLQYKKYLSDSKGKRITNLWDDIHYINNNDNLNDYSTKKPLELISRIVKSLSNEGDVVTDFFMGSGTTIESCLINNRHFIGCDINPDAFIRTSNIIQKYNNP